MTIDKNIAIAILARDCEKTLPNNIKKIERLRKHFSDSFVIIVENDSIDQTKNILKEWEKNSKNIVVISEDYHTKTIPEKTLKCPFPGTSKYRMDKMCFYRNKYMEYLKNTNIEYDYLIIIDIDIDDFSEQGVISAIVNAPPDWTALFANGVRYIKIFKRIRIGYYDGYPLILFDEKVDNIIIDKSFKEVAESMCKIVKERKRKKYIKCVSAFGGIGIYKYPYVKNEHYHTIYNTRSSVFEVLCDHVSLNYTLYKKNVGTNYIVSKMVVYYEQIKNYKVFISEILTEIMPFKLRLFINENIRRKEYSI